jgi:site-specific recombinase XerD
MRPVAANQFRKAPPFQSEFIRRYEAAKAPGWMKSQLITQRVGLRRFDGWLAVSGAKLSELNWHKLLDFHRFLTQQGYGPHPAKRGLEVAKSVLRWGIETGELPQKYDEIYTFHFIHNAWSNELPELSEKFLAQVEVPYPGAVTSHRYSHRVFHAYLKEKKLTYRRLRRDDLVKFVKYTQEKKLGQRTRSAVTRHARAYLRWLKEEKKISRSVDELFPGHLIPKIPKTLPRPLDPELDYRMQKVLEETDDIYYQSILLIRRTGLRSAELRKLAFDCIEFDPKKRARLVVPPVKLGIERRVPLDDSLVALIRKIQAMSVQNFKISKQPPVLVIGYTGTPPRYERFADAMAEVCSKLNTKKWINLHALRHTYATNLLNAGLSVTSLKEILGHKSIHMSLGYAKVTQEKIHAEYQSALSMNSARIPELLLPKPQSLDDAFQILTQVIAKRRDSGADEKKLKAILNRLAKIKMDLGKLR